MEENKKVGKKEDLKEDIRVSDLIEAEQEIINANKYAQEILIEYSNLYETIIGDSAECKALEEDIKRPQGENRICELKHSVLDLIFILEQIKTYRSQFEKIIG